MGERLINPSIFSAIQKLCKLLTQKDKLKWVRFIGFSLITSIFEIITATFIILFAQVINQPQLGQKYLTKAGITTVLSSSQIILYMAICVAIIYIVKNIISSSEVFYLNFTIQKMNYEFKKKLLYKYTEIDYGFYLTRNSSLGHAIVGGDVEHIFSGGMISIATILSESVVFICLITMVVVMNPVLAIAIFSIGTIIGLFITKVLFPRFYRWGLLMQEASLYCNQNLLQFFHGFKEIILLNKRNEFIDSFNVYSLKKSRTLAINTATNALPRMVIEVIFMALFVTTIALLCFEKETPVHMMGILSGYLYTGFRLMPGLNRIISQLNIFKNVIPSIERVFTEYNTLEVKENYVDVPNFSFKSSIYLSDIHFCYPTVDKDALNGISLEIKRGENIGIIGETGSGKSTLVDVILGLLKPYKGSIQIDKSYPVNSYQWHNRIGYVPQSVYLIDDSIEANIAFGDKNIDELSMNAAIDAAQLRKFINQLPRGEKTLVGERGIRLSGGERQRIAIARALYRKPEVLIFDEATSALDNETEARLMETIKTVSQDRTVIMIAHRLTTLKDCDRIVQMDNGVIRNITNYENCQKTRVKNHG